MTTTDSPSRWLVLLLFGTRPEIVKLAPVVRALEADSDRCRYVCVATGQHEDLVEPFAREFGVPIHYDLGIGRQLQTPSEICARVLLEFDSLLARKVSTAVPRGVPRAEPRGVPNVVLVQGDTSSALAGALAAFHRGIPVGHVEAGLRSGNAQDPFPEEMNRRLITRLATFHFAATARNRDALLAERVPQKYVAITGNPVVDSVQWALGHTTPSRYASEIMSRIGGRRLLLLTTHRRESFGTTLRERLEILADFVDRHEDIQLVFPAHPNPEVQTQTHAALAGHTRIEIIRPLEYLDFIHLMASSWLVVSDSGGVQEECCSLHRPLLVIRAITERPEAIESGTARLVGGSIREFATALEEAEAGAQWMTEIAPSASPFGNGDAGRRIASTLLDWLEPRAPKSSR